MFLFSHVSFAQTAPIDTSAAQKNSNCNLITSLESTCATDPSAKVSLVGGGEASCANQSALASLKRNNCEAGASVSEDAERCLTSYNEWKEAREENTENSENLQDDIQELQQSKVDKQREHQEAIRDLDEQVTDAEKELRDTMEAIQEETDSANQEKSEKVQELSEKMDVAVRDLRRAVITDRNKVERDAQQQKTAAYDQCKAAAEKDYADRTNATKARSRAENTGQAPSGGAGFNKKSRKQIKLEVTETYRTCIARVDSAITADRTNKLEELSDKQTEAQSRKDAADTELRTYLTETFPAKSQRLNQRLQNAQNQYQQKVQTVSQQKAQLEQTHNQQMALIDQQISTKQSRVLTVSSARERRNVRGGTSRSPSPRERSARRNSEEEGYSELQGALEDAKAACCQGGTIISSYTKGMPTASFCTRSMRVKSGAQGPASR